MLLGVHVHRVTGGFHGEPLRERYLSAWEA